MSDKGLAKIGMWIKSDCDFLSDPRMDDLEAALVIPRVILMGHLKALYHACFKHYQGGIVAPPNVERKVATAARYPAVIPGEAPLYPQPPADKFVAAMVDAGYVRRQADGTVEIVDWEELIRYHFFFKKRRQVELEQGRVRVSEYRKRNPETTHERARTKYGAPSLKDLTVTPDPTAEDAGVTLDEALGNAGISVTEALGNADIPVTADPKSAKKRTYSKISDLRHVPESAVLSGAAAIVSKTETVESQPVPKSNGPKSVTEPLGNANFAARGEERRREEKKKEKRAEGDFDTGASEPERPLSGLAAARDRLVLLFMDLTKTKFPNERPEFNRSFMEFKFVAWLKRLGEAECEKRTRDYFRSTDPFVTNTVAFSWDYFVKAFHRLGGGPIENKTGGIDDGGYDKPRKIGTISDFD